MPGLINLDFADIRTIMAGMGKAMMGTGEATGEDRALRAAEQAIANPLLDEALSGARGLIISIQGGDDMRLMEVDEVAMHIKEMVDPEADIIWGSTFNSELDGRIRVSVVATGIDSIRLPDAVLAPAAIVSVEAAQIRAAAWCPAPKPAPVLADLVEIAACLEARAFQEEVQDGELLLGAENVLLLTAPEGAAEFATLDPFTAEPAAEQPMATLTPIRGPSLFERMAMVARGTAHQTDMPAMPQFYRGRDVDVDAPRFARAA
jgi:cell division protein FtsZ